MPKGEGICPQKQKGRQDTILSDLSLQPFFYFWPVLPTIQDSSHVHVACLNFLPLATRTKGIPSNLYLRRVWWGCACGFFVIRLEACIGRDCCWSRGQLGGESL